MWLSRQPVLELQMLPVALERDQHCPDAVGEVVLPPVWACVRCVWQRMKAAHSRDLVDGSSSWPGVCRVHEMEKGNCAFLLGRSDVWLEIPGQAGALLALCCADFEVEFQCCCFGSSNIFTACGRFVRLVALGEERMIYFRGIRLIYRLRVRRRHRWEKTSEMGSE